MSSTKKRAAPKPPGDGQITVNGSDSATPSNGITSNGEDFIDETIKLTVVLPDQSREEIHIVASTALFDLRTQLCGKYKLNHSAHQLEPVDINGRAIQSFTSSSTLESTGAVAVHLVPKVKNAPKIAPIKTVEQSVRVTVKTSQSHQQVVRVRPTVPLRTILSNILEKTNFSKDSHKNLELRHPAKTSEPLDLSKSLDDYDKLREVFVVDKKDKQFKDTKEGKKDGSKKGKKIKKLFKFGRKKSKGDIASPTSLSPPPSSPDVELPATYNEKGVDVETPTTKRPAPVKQPSLQSQEDADMQQDSDDAKKTKSPPPRPVAQPRPKPRATAPRPPTTGKKKAPAPPTPTAQPSSSTESSQPVTKSTRPDKPPRRMSIEKAKDIQEDKEDDVVDGMVEQEEHVRSETLVASSSVKGTESSGGADVVSEGERDCESVTEDALDNVEDKPTVKKQEEEAITLPPPTERTDFKLFASDDESDHESLPEKEVVDSVVEEDREIHKEPSEFGKSETGHSSDNVGAVEIVKQSVNLEAPDQHAVAAESGLPIDEEITEDVLRDLSDIEISAESDQSDVEVSMSPTERGAESAKVFTEAKTADASGTASPFSETHRPTSRPDSPDKPPSPTPVVIEQKNPSPPPEIFEQRTPSPPPVVIEQRSPSPLPDFAPGPQSPVTQDRAKTLSPPPVDEDQFVVPPPPLQDDDNLFTTPQDYNVYDADEEDIGTLEAEALARLQQFNASMQDDEQPSLPDSHKTADQVNGRPVMPQDEESEDEEKTLEEIERVKRELEIAKQKKAQKEAEEEHRRKNPYTIVPDQKPEAAPFGKTKTYTFVPNQRAKKHEDYEAAPQTVIKFSDLGEIKGVTTVTADTNISKTDVETPTPQAENVVIVTPLAITSAPVSIVVPKQYTTPAFAKAPTTPSSSKSPITTVKAPSGPAKKPPTAASIMVDYLSGQKSQTTPDVKIIETSKPDAPKTAGSAAPIKTRVAGGYVNSAIMKQPVATDNKASSVSAVHDRSGGKKSALPSYYKRFLGVDAVTGTDKAVGKFKSNAADKKNVANSNVVRGQQNSPAPTTVSPPSPTKPPVAGKPTSLPFKPPTPKASSPTSPVAISLNRALNPTPGTNLPAPPEEKRTVGVTDTDLTGTPLPPPPEEFLSSGKPSGGPMSPVRSVTTPSPTSPKGFVGISSAKPFNSASTGGFRPMTAAFKSGKSNKANSP